jgi:NifU-like protein involved in Fe-S cluster formation
VRSLFAQPEHAGAMSSPYRVCIDDQGIRVAFSATLDDGVIERLRFRAWGCPHVIAAAEWVCTQLEGKPAAELQSFAVAGLMQSLMWITL